MFTFIGHSDIGKRKKQGDAFYTWPTQPASNDSGCIGVVFDEVADSKGASLYAKQAFEENLDQWHNAAGSDASLQAIVTTVERAHNRIVHRSRSERDIMASTVVAAAIRDDQVCIVWCGDSRAYLFRAGQLIRLTTDHSQVGEFVLQGTLRESQVLNHPQKNIITRALGSPDARPHGTVIELQPGDGVLLISDGVLDGLTEAEIRQCLCEHEDDSTLSEHLVRAAVDAGSRDNTTALWYRHAEHETSPAQSFHPLRVAEASRRIPKQPTTDSVQSRRDNKPPGTPPKKPVPKSTGAAPMVAETIDLYGNRQEVPLESSPVRIGRSPAADLSLAGDSYANTHHLHLERDGDAVTVTDNESANGVYVKLSGKATLQPPFDLVAGSTVIRVRDAEEGGSQ